MEITHLDPDSEVWGEEEKTEKRHVDRYVTLLTDIQIRTYIHAYIQLDETEAGRYTRGDCGKTCNRKYMDRYTDGDKNKDRDDGLTGS